MSPKITNKISLNKTFNNSKKKPYSGFCVKIDWRKI